MLPAPEQSAHCKCNFCSADFFQPDSGTQQILHMYIFRPAAALLTSGLPALLPADLYYLFFVRLSSSFLRSGLSSFSRKAVSSSAFSPATRILSPPPDALQSRAGSADRSVLPAASLHLPVSACRATLLPHSIHFPGQRLLSGAELRQMPFAGRNARKRIFHSRFRILQHKRNSAIRICRPDAVFCQITITLHKLSL